MKKNKHPHCPCGKMISYKLCCGRFIIHNKSPQTAEELMRSRYTAYTKANVDYIAKTMRPPASNEFNPVNAQTWAKSVKWHKLEVLAHSTQGEVAYVEFAAYFYQNKQLEVIHENSVFHLIEGQWYYVAAIPNNHSLK